MVVYEGVNELESWAHSPPFQGGVAARLQELAPFLAWRSRGGFQNKENHPGRFCEVASRYFLSGGHPSLERRGMRPRFQFIPTRTAHGSDFDDRAYNSK